jgi:hypothetical protein
MTLIPDLQAATDIVNDAAQASDSFTVEECLGTLETLKTLKSAVNDAISFVETQLKSRLDSPVQVGDTVYALKPAGKWRPDHDRIKSMIAKWSVVDLSTGETFDRDTAVSRAISLCYDAFVAPSTMPKQGILTALGVDKRDIAAWQRTGTDIATMEVMGVED